MIPDNAAAKRQKANSFHICPRALNIWLAVPEEVSLTTKTGRGSRWNVMFGDSDMTGKVTSIQLLPELRRQFAKRQTRSFQYSEPFGRTLGNWNLLSQWNLTRSHGFLDMQKNLAFRIMKANRTVLKDILCEVLHLEKNYLQRQKLSEGLLWHQITCQTVKENLLAKSFME